MGFLAMDPVHSRPAGPQTGLEIEIILVRYPGAVLGGAGSAPFWCPVVRRHISVCGIILFTDRNMRMSERGVSLGVGVSPHGDVSFRPLSPGKGL